jgi:hypothetical protein
MVVVQDGYFHCFFSSQNNPPEIIKRILSALVRDQREGLDFPAQALNQSFVYNIQPSQMQHLRRRTPCTTFRSSIQDREQLPQETRVPVLMSGIKCSPMAGAKAVQFSGHVPPVSKITIAMKTKTTSAPFARRPVSLEELIPLRASV